MDDTKMADQGPATNDNEEKNSDVNTFSDKIYIRPDNIDDEVKKFVAMKYIPRELESLKGDPVYDILSKYSNNKDKCNQIKINWENVKFTIIPDDQPKKTASTRFYAIYKNDFKNDTKVADGTQTHILKFGSSSSSTNSVKLTKSDISTGSLSFKAGISDILMFQGKGQLEKGKSKTDSSDTKTEDNWSAESQIVVKGSQVCEVKHVMTTWQYKGAFDICMVGTVHINVGGCELQIPVQQAFGIPKIDNKLRNKYKYKRCEDYKEYQNGDIKGVKKREVGNYIYDVQHKIIAKYYTKENWTKEKKNREEAAKEHEKNSSIQN